MPSFALLHHAFRMCNGRVIIIGLIELDHSGLGRVVPRIGCPSLESCSDSLGLLNLLEVLIKSILIRRRELRLLGKGRSNLLLSLTECH